MSNITKTPAAELLAEWERFNELRVLAHVRGESDHHAKYLHECATRAAELDRRCNDAGIGLYKDGSFWYSQRTKDDHENMFAITTSNTQQIAAREQHALEGWLLIRDGK